MSQRRQIIDVESLRRREIDFTALVLLKQGFAF
jgi:hypothetical protein